MKIRVGTIIFVSSFILQLIVMYLSGGYRQPELYEYEEIAVNLLMKHTFLGHRLGAACYSLLAPLYPFLCAITYLLTDYSHLAMLLVQITLTSLICVIIYLVGKEVFNKKTGIIGAIFCIFHPGLIIYSTTKLHDLVLVAFMFCLLILTVLKFEKDLTYQRSIFIGILMGLCILARASIVLFIPLFLIWLDRKDIRGRWLKSLVIISITGIVILPWIIRNYYIHREFVFIQAPSINLWVGNNIHATGGNYLKDGRMVLEAMPEDFVNKVYAADELTKDKIFKEEVYKFIKAHPYKFISLFFKKLYYFWWFSAVAGIKYPYLYMVGYKVWYAIILFFAICGGFFALSSGGYGVRNKAWLLLIFFMGISIMQSLFYVECRHRWTIEPLILIFSANGISRAWDKFKFL